MYANYVEIEHASLYQKALDQMKNLKEADYYVCSVCGYTCADKAPKVCPICGSKAEAFSRVD
jgi:rubrerythrin